MARMYPRTLIASEVKSDAEKRVFAALRDGLDDDWEAFHSVSWMMRDPAEGSADGEIDFVLCHPDGGDPLPRGQGRRDRVPPRRVVPAQGRQARAHQGPVHAGARPPLRPRAASSTEFDGLEEARRLHRPGARLPRHHRPQARAGPRRAARDRHRPTTTSTEIAASIERVLDYHRGAREKRKPPGRERREALRELLAPEVRIEVPMASEFLDEEEALITLTHEQAMLLNRFGRDRRMVITGCAGSGKTMLAVEQAKRLAREGQGRALRLLQPRAARSPARARGEVRGRLLELPRALRRTSPARPGSSCPSYPEDEAPPEFCDEELPNALVEAIEELGPQYDALFVDEAQDLENDWLDALMLDAPRSATKGQVWLFMDDNQRVYEAQLDVPKEFRPFDLTVNCRNTQAIAREVLKKYEGEIEPEVIGPAGPRGRAALRPTTRSRPSARSSSASAARRRSRRRTSSSSPPTTSRTRRSASAGCRRRTPSSRSPSPLGPYDPLLLDPRLQGPRVAGRDPLRARGPRRRDDRPAALRRHLAGAEPLRGGGAGSAVLTCSMLELRVRSAPAHRLND